MNMNEAYEYALRNGRAKAFSTLYVRALRKNKGHERALVQAVKQMELSSEDSFSPAARTLYALHYRRSIERGLDEHDARKIALDYAMLAMRR